MWLHSSAQSESWRAFWLEWRSVLWARKQLFLALLGLIFALGTSVMALRQPLYESSVKILVTREMEAQPGAAQVKGELGKEELHSEIELLNSRAVLEEVAQELQLSPAESALQQLSARLAITTVENSRIIKATYRDSSPEQAAKFLNTLFQKYSLYRQTLRSQTSPDTVLRERSAAFNQKIETATKALKNLDAQNGLATSTAQQELLLKQFYEVQKQAEAAQIERREVEQRSLALRAQLATQPEQIETGSVTKYGSALDKMKEELLALELQRTQLQQKYQPNHRLLRDHEQRLAQAKALIAQEEQNPPRERSFALNETRRRVSDDLLQAEAHLAALVQREQRLNELVRTYQSQLVALNVQSFKKSGLERERAMNEDAWRLFEQKAQEAEITTVLQQANGVQVSLVETAGIHPRPINRRWSRDLAGLLFLGLVISVGGTVLVESLNPRLRHEAGLRRRFGLEVLASLPAHEASAQDS